MYVYKLKEAIMALAHTEREPMKIVTLEAGTVVRTLKAGVTLPTTGLIEVKINGDTLAAFRQDLEQRGERIDPAESGAGLKPL